ncbi:hypothetical protein ONZ45_g640 [Pleurotus djamor]|nr:hypothetical protein ONZ45_g640 [Pleurotus djamor]
MAALSSFEGRSKLAGERLVVTGGRGSCQLRVLIFRTLPPTLLRTVLHVFALKIRQHFLSTYFKPIHITVLIPLPSIYGGPPSMESIPLHVLIWSLPFEDSLVTSTPPFSTGVEVIHGIHPTPPLLIWSLPLEDALVVETQSVGGSIHRVDLRPPILHTNHLEATLTVDHLSLLWNGGGSMPRWACFPFCSVPEGEMSLGGQAMYFDLRKHHQDRPGTPTSGESPRRVRSYHQLGPRLLKYPIIGYRSLPPKTHINTTPPTALPKIQNTTHQTSTHS